MSNKKNLIYNIILIFLFSILIFFISKVCIVESNANEKNEVNKETATKTEANIDTIPERNLYFEVNKDKERQLGDVNADGKIDMTDYYIITLYVTDLALGFDMSEYEVVKKYGDCNGDGRLTAIDGAWTGRHWGLGKIKLSDPNMDMKTFVETFDENFMIDEEGVLVPRPKNSK